MASIVSRRLHAQGLAGTTAGSAVDVLRRMGAIQAQDYGAATWGLGLRCRRSTEIEVDRLFDGGSILRTHLMRPTWHFVLPEDVRWLLDLTGPRVRQGAAGRYRELGIDAAAISRSQAAFTAALAGGRHLTRPELGEVLARAGVPPNGQRLPHLLMAAELDGLIVSGPRRGRQFTWALLDERVPPARPLERDEALLELTLRFFRSRGPAQVQDFVWWSGLTAADARAGIAAAGGGLGREVLDGREHWCDAAAPAPSRSRRVAHLLPNFDEYTVAYRDRSAIHSDGAIDPAMLSFGSILSNVVIVGGRVRGAWARHVTAGELRVELRLPEPLTGAEREAVEAAVSRLGGFLGRPAQLA